MEALCARLPGCEEDVLVEVSVAGKGLFVWGDDVDAEAEPGGIEGGDFIGGGVVDDCDALVCDDESGEVGGEGSEIWGGVGGSEDGLPV